MQRGVNSEWKFVNFKLDLPSQNSFEAAEEKKNTKNIPSTYWILRLGSVLIKYQHRNTGLEIHTFKSRCVMCFFLTLIT